MSDTKTPETGEIVSALTPMQKLHALAYRFYQGGVWEPKVGDYYTTTRADLQLYQIVDIRDGIVSTSYLPLGGPIATWPEAEFLVCGFGPRRLYVPPWILSMPTEERQIDRLNAALAALQARVRRLVSDDHLVEAVAQAIHDTDGMADTTWPTDHGDDGWRGDGVWVRLCRDPDLYREASRNALRAIGDALSTAGDTTGEGRDDEQSSDMGIPISPPAALKGESDG